MKIVLMCPKCGKVRTPNDSDHSYNICEYCKTDTIKIDFDPDAFWTTEGEERIAVENKIWRKFLYSNPQFNEQLLEKRVEEERKEHIEAVRFLNEHRVQSNTPKCPYCNSFYVEKITTGGRLLSTALFGLGSSKVGKQWHCKQCGSNF